MNSLLKFLVIILLIGLVYCKEVCYDELGCFKDTDPFGGTEQRPFNLLPESPKRINTTFLLFKREFKSFRRLNRFKIIKSYNPSLQTKIIVHGFLQRGLVKIWQDTAFNALNFGNINVIFVDWKNGNGFPYEQAATNTQIVGAEIALLIKTLISTKKAKARDFHLIGFSLGSYACGYAGKIVPGLGRITALDPPGKYFENSDPIVTLVKSDAKYFDVIRTELNAKQRLAENTIQPIGHIDFYSTSNKYQPKCQFKTSKILGIIYNPVILVITDQKGIKGKCYYGAYHFFDDSIKNKYDYTDFLYFYIYSCNFTDICSE